MTKAELVALVADKAGLTKKDSEKARCWEYWCAEDQKEEILVS